MSTKQNIYLQLAGVVKSDERAIRVLQRSKTEASNWGLELSQTLVQLSTLKRED